MPPSSRKSAPALTITLLLALALLSHSAVGCFGGGLPSIAFVRVAAGQSQVWISHPPSDQAERVSPADSNAHHPRMTPW